MQKLEKGELAFRVGTRAKVWAVAVGAVFLHFSCDRILVLNNIFYVNLISISRLMEFNYSVLSILVLISVEMEMLYVPVECMTTYIIYILLLPHCIITTRKLNFP